MTGDEAILAVIRALNELDVPYMLTGSVATNVHGIPRSTEDVDFVVQLSEGKGIADISRKLGPRFRAERQASFESITVSQRFLFHVQGSSFKVELFLLKDEEFDRSRFSRRVRLEFESEYVWAPTIDDIVVNKLWWAHIAHRRKDLEDAANVIGTRGELIDWSYVYRWCDFHGTRQLLDEIRASIPSDKG